MGRRAAPMHAVAACASARLPAAGSACPVVALLAKKARGGSLAAAAAGAAWLRGVALLTPVSGSSAETAAPTSARVRVHACVDACERE